MDELIVGHCTQVYSIFCASNLAFDICIEEHSPIALLPAWGDDPLQPGDPGGGGGGGSQREGGGGGGGGGSQREVRTDF